MADMVKARVGFVSGGQSSMPHYNSFLPIVPKDIQVDFQGMELYGASLYEIANKKEFIVGRVKELVAARDWNGVIVTAAPTEVLNPGLSTLQRAVDSVLTALNACVAALRVSPESTAAPPFDARESIDRQAYGSRCNRYISHSLPTPCQTDDAGQYFEQPDNLAAVTN
jgi:hypothetical protein